MQLNKEDKEVVEKVINDEYKHNPIFHTKFDQYYDINGVIPSPKESLQMYQKELFFNLDKETKLHVSISKNQESFNLQFYSNKKIYEITLDQFNLINKKINFELESYDK